MTERLDVGRNRPLELGAREFASGRRVVDTWTRGLVLRSTA